MNSTEKSFKILITFHIKRNNEFSVSKEKNVYFYIFLELVEVPNYIGYKFKI